MVLIFKRSNVHRMKNSNNTTKDSEPLNRLEALDRLLEPDWEEDSQVTVNVNIPHVPVTNSYVDKLKDKMPTKKQAGIGGIILMILAALGKLAQELGWF